MLIEYTGICQHCAAEVKTLTLTDRVVGKCHACGHEPFTLRKVKALIYVVANPNQRGVKVGLTTKSMEDRIRSLNSTGVAGDFVPIAIFPSERPKFDEERVHDKLRSHHLAKEHFDVEPVEAVLKAYRALNKREPIFFDDSVKETFRLKLEEAKIQMQLRLRGEGK